MTKITLEDIDTIYGLIMDRDFEAAHEKVKPFMNKADPSFMLLAKYIPVSLSATMSIWQETGNHELASEFLLENFARGLNTDLEIDAACKSIIAQELN